MSEGKKAVIAYKMAGGGLPLFLLLADSGEKRYINGMGEVEKKPRKARKKTDIVENGGKVIVNLGQLVFGTLFLGSVLRGEIPQYMMMIGGIVGAGILIMIGLLMSAKERKSKEE
jgi:hypothetical protein